MFRILLTLAAAILATIVAAKLTFEANSYSGREPVNQPWTQGTMEFVSWNDEQWAAWIRSGKFEQSPQDTVNWSRHANTSIAYTGWEGKLWQAKIEGEEFLLAHRGNWGGHIERTSAIRYRDWTGRNQLRTVAQLRR